MRFLNILIAVVLISLLGCGADTGIREAAPRASKKDKSASKDGVLASKPDEEPVQGEPAGRLQKPAEQKPRKIIYIAQVELIVEDLVHGEEQLKSLIQEQNAYDLVHGEEQLKSLIQEQN